MTGIPLGLRKRARLELAHFRVGDAATATPPALAPGLVPIFAGWNVWDVWQADKPSFSVMNLGLSLQRQLQIWVENAVKDGAPGSDVADPLNPAALRGDQVQIIPHVMGLAIAATRADIPELANASLNSGGNTATLYTVRFWSRASAPQYSVATSMAWPHDDDYLLNVVYTPTAQNAVTGAPQPSSLAGAAGAAADVAGEALKVVAIIGGVVLAGGIIIALASAGKKAAA